MTLAYARSDSRIRLRRPETAVAAVSLLPLVALTLASLESAVVYAAGQILRSFGAQ